MKLPRSFYTRDNVVQIAKELLGKVLYTYIDGRLAAGIITETEAYAGIADKASHAYNDRRTVRTEVMYAKGGTSYVYLCYGIHHLFNVVTNYKDAPHAILVRALEPVKGIDTMLRRVGKNKLNNTLTRGPGNLSKALGITTTHSGYSLRRKELFIADDGVEYSRKEIISSPRIGVDYAGTHALWPYRFYVKGNVYVSGIK